MNDVCISSKSTQTRLTDRSQKTYLLFQPKLKSIDPIIFFLFDTTRSDCSSFSRNLFSGRGDEELLSAGNPIFTTVCHFEGARVAIAKVWDIKGLEDGRRRFPVSAKLKSKREKSFNMQRHKFLWHPTISHLL